MKRTRPDHLTAQIGFSLVESVIVLVVLSIAAAAIISLQGGTTHLVAKFLYGNSLRLMEAVRLRPRTSRIR